MEIEFDPNKDRLNIKNHNISLEQANLLEWETLWANRDDRFDYGEVRMVGYVYLGMRLMCVVYTDRGNLRRIISLRKATKREIRNYAKA